MFVGQQVFGQLGCANGGAHEDAGESPAGAGLTVFLDLNQNSVLDMHDYEATTNASGEYVFENLVPGEYYLEMVLPDGYELKTTIQEELIVRDASHIQVDIGIHEKTAEDDFFQTDEDTPLDIPISSLTANDLEEVPSTENPVSFHDFTQPEHGALSQDGNILEYVPEADWHGVDTFYYCLADGQGYYD